MLVPAFEETPLMLAVTAASIGNCLRWSVPASPALHWFDTASAVAVYLLMCGYVDNTPGLVATVVCYLWVCLTPGFSRTRHHCFHYLGYCVLARHVGWSLQQLVVSSCIYWSIVLLWPIVEEVEEVASYLHSVIGGFQDLIGSL
jgi:hypothetical protein